jgi:hypothetical protein
MNDNIKVGDLVECIDETGCRNCGETLGLKLHSVYEVKEISVGHITVLDKDSYAIKLIGDTGCKNPNCAYVLNYSTGWCGAHRFTKFSN